MKELTIKMEDLRLDIENSLSKYMNLFNNQRVNKTLLNSMKYSLLNGGKRIRGILLIEFFKLFSMYSDAVMPFACAVEMIHAASLIHDDLPCMDNSETRRNKPSNHVVFGDAISTIAGDALLALAFYVITCEDTINKVGYEKSVFSSRILSDVNGVNGMASGQVSDLYPKSICNFEVMEMYMGKTAKLIAASTEIGTLIAGASNEDRVNSRKYGELLGLQYQLVDDLLDVIGDKSILGKPVKKDNENNKITYISIYGEQKTREKIKELSLKALDLLDKFYGDTTLLKNITIELSSRIN